MSLLTIITLIKDILTSAKTVKDLSGKSQVQQVTNSTVINNFQGEEKKERASLLLNNLQSKLRELFNSHSIEDNLIVEFLKQSIDKKFNIPASKSSNLEYIFDNLTDEHIDKIVKVFGINKGWLFDRDELYTYSNYYNNVFSFISFVIEKNKTEKLNAYAFRIADFDFKDKQRYQPLYLILRTPIVTIYDKTIYRYYHISTDWKWNYWRTRFKIKSIFRLFETPNNYLNIDGKTLTKEEIALISNRNNCPDEIIRNKVMNAWFPYDYSTKLEENVNALELKEIDNVISYIESQGYEEHFKKKAGNTIYST